AVDAHAVFVDDFEDGPGGYVTGDEIPVFRVPLFEEVPAVGFGDGFSDALVGLVTGNPDAATFAAGRLGHEAELVFAGDGGGVHLDEFAVGVEGSLLVEGGLGGAGANYGVGGFAEYGSVAAGADD